MARIRTIKPEFFTSEDIVDLTPLARLFYVSLWCEADREGRLSWKPKTLKMRYLPGDDCDVDILATELTKAGLVVIYEVDGKQYAEIPSFKTHQVINNRESESVIPPRVKDASPRVKAEGRKEGKGKEGKERRVDDALPGWLDLEAWKAFEKHRREIKSPLTPEAAKKNLTVLEAHRGKQAEIVEKAIRSGWRGLFPPKEDTVTRGHRPELEEFPDA